MTLNFLNKKISYDSVDDKDVLLIINRIRQGIEYSLFISIANKSPLSMQEWSNFLHISERTLQRYKKEKRTFDTLQSERILQIVLLIELGIDVFGTEEKFNNWLETENLALGKINPKELLDNAFGISLLKDELNRIGHGVLA